jgi:hypothetical protein
MQVHRKISSYVARTPTKHKHLQINTPRTEITQAARRCLMLEQKSQATKRERQNITHNPSKKTGPATKTTNLRSGAQTRTLVVQLMASLQKKKEKKSVFSCAQWCVSPSCSRGETRHRQATDQRLRVYQAAGAA